MRYESIFSHTHGSLTRLCGFLGVEVEADYLHACASRIFEKPHKSRHKMEWTTELKRQVADRMRQYHVFQEYSFDMWGDAS